MIFLSYSLDVKSDVALVRASRHHIALLLLLGLCPLVLLIISSQDLLEFLRCPSVYSSSSESVNTTAFFGSRGGALTIFISSTLTRRLGSSPRYMAVTVMTPETNTDFSSNIFLSNCSSFGFRYKVLKSSFSTSALRSGF